MVIWRQLEEREFAGVNALNSRAGALQWRRHGRPGKLSPGCLFSVDRIALCRRRKWKSADRRGAIFMSIGEIHAFVDILRNEKPIFGHLRGDLSPVDERHHHQRTGRHRR